MRILFILHRYPATGGIENVTSILANEFVQRYNYEVQIFSCIQQRKSNNRFQLHENIPVTIVNSNNLATIKIQFQKFLQTQGPFDIAIFQDSYAPIESILFSLPSSTRLIICEHNTPDCNLKQYCHYWKGLSWRNFHDSIRKIAGTYKYPKIIYQTISRHKKLIKRADLYVVLSPSYIQMMRKDFKLDANNIIAIPNPNTINSTQINTSSSERNNILFVGRLCKEKGIGHLLNIWKLIEEQKNAIEGKLLIIGGGEELLKSKETAKKLGLERVHFLGEETEIEQFYNSGSCLLMTSIFEGFGLVLIEAMSRGCIPFAFDSFSSCHDIIENKETGYIIPAFDEKTYAQQVVSFLNLPKARQDKMRLAAIKKSQFYSIENICKLWNKIFTNYTTHHR